MDTQPIQKRTLLQQIAVSSQLENQQTAQVSSIQNPTSAQIKPIKWERKRDISELEKQSLGELITQSIQVFSKFLSSRIIALPKEVLEKNGPFLNISIDHIQENQRINKFESHIGTRYIIDLQFILKHQDSKTLFSKDAGTIKFQIKRYIPKNTPEFGYSYFSDINLQTSFQGKGIGPIVLDAYHDMLQECSIILSQLQVVSAIPSTANTYRKLRYKLTGESEAEIIKFYREWDRAWKFLSNEGKLSIIKFFNERQSGKLEVDFDAMLKSIRSRDMKIIEETIEPFLITHRLNQEDINKMDDQSLLELFFKDSSPTNLKLKYMYRWTNEENQVKENQPIFNVDKFLENYMQSAEPGI